MNRYDPANGKLHTMLLLIAVFLGLTAQSLYADVSFAYDFSEPQLADRDGFSAISMPQTRLLSQPGGPALPWRAVSIALPPGQIATSIEVIPVDEITLPGQHLPAPGGAVRPISQPGDGVVTMNPDLYALSQPQKIHSSFTTQFLHGTGFLVTRLCPMRWDAATHTLSWYPRLRIHVRTAPDPDAAFHQAMRSSRPAALASLQDMADNPDMLHAYPTPRAGRDPYEVLIITPSAYEATFAPLIDFHLTRGFRSRVVTIETIQSQNPGADLQEKIRNRIIDEYQTGEIEYVLLGGDVELVPYRGFYCIVHSSSDYVDESIPTDFYYAGLDGDWNDDDDDHWGEFYEADLCPEVSLGRLPFGNELEQQRMIDKTIAHQTWALRTARMQPPVFAAEKLWELPLTWGGDHIDHVAGEGGLQYGYQTEGYSADYDEAHFLYDRDSGVWTKGMLRELINTGTEFIHHSGHANTGYVMRMHTADVLGDHFSSCNGFDSVNPLLYTHGCNCGAFDEDDCIAELMLMQEYFLAGFVGNSRYGWFNEGTSDGPSTHLHREFVNAMMSSRYAGIGKFHELSRLQTVPWCGLPTEHEPGAQLWCMYACNVLGDPVLIPLRGMHDWLIMSDLGPASVSLDADAYLLGHSFKHGVISQGTNLLGVAHPSQGETNLISVSGAVPGPATLHWVRGIPFLRELGERSITFIQPNSAGLESWSLHGGWPNVQPAPGGTLYLHASLHHYGSSVPLQDISLQLETGVDWILIPSPVYTLTEPLNPGETVELSGILEITLSPDAPVGETGMMNLSVISTHGTNVYEIPVYVEQGSLTYQSCRTNTSAVIPNEEFWLSLYFRNDGALNGSGVTATLATDDPNVTILDGTGEVSLDYNQYYNLCRTEFRVMLLNQESQLIPFTWEIGDFSGTFQFRYDDYTETFENGEYTLIDWTQSGSAEWTFDPDGADGWCVTAGGLADNQYATLRISPQLTSRWQQISFDMRTSTQTTSDFLVFRINGNTVGSFSGEIPWQTCSYDLEDWLEPLFYCQPVLLEWSYAMDNNGNGGENRVWLDNIVLPNPVQISANPDDVPAPVLLDPVNYPNPFNPETTIAFSLSKPCEVQLSIYNIRGQRVRQLVNQPLAAGRHHFIWRGRDDNDHALSTGIYMYRIEAGTNIVTRKIMLLK